MIVLRNTCYLLFCFLFASSFLKAQTLNEDSIYNLARERAAQQAYSEAIALLRELCDYAPNNLDYSIYLARLYYWSDDVEAAHKELMRLWSENDPNEEALNLLIGIELKRENYREVITRAQQGLQLFPDNKYHHLFEIALGHNGLNEDKEALDALAQIPKEDNNWKAASYLENQILQKKKNFISTGYLLSHFFDSTVQPQQLAHLEYGHKFGKNSLIARINYGNMFGYRAFQGELDGYFKLHKSGYAYANIGFSDGQSIFPLFRSGLEYYHDFKNLSSSLGMRYLHFSSQIRVYMFTGHLALSHKSWTFSYRPFLAYVSKSWLASNVFYLRKNFYLKESYVQLDLQQGALPYYFFTSVLLTRLNSYRVGMSAKCRFAKNFFLQPIFLYEREEHLPRQYRNRYNFQLILSYRF